MENHTARSPRPGRLLNLILRRGLPFLAFTIVCAHSAAGAEDAGRTLQLLRGRQQEQMRRSVDRPVFHKFQLTNRLEASGITFQHHAVDDAAKNWQPAHYDHGTGIAVADVDNDGLPDIYFVDQLGQSQLWRNLGQGKFENITQKASVGQEGKVCVAASFADIDNDGDPDLFVTSVRMGNALFENLGGGRFRNISKGAGVDYSGHSSGAVFFDYDRDGLLDLFVANVGVYTTDAKGRGGFYLAVTNAFAGHLIPERTERSILYKNLGEHKFKDVSVETKLIDNGWSGDASFCDLNQDGFPDLYVLNMQGGNHYYENQGGKTFVEKIADYFPKTPWGAMGIKFFDFNQDGLTDLFVTDMHSDMTARQSQLARNFSLEIERAKSEAWCGPEWATSFLPGGTSSNIFGNALWQNLGQGRFQECSTQLNAETFWPWGLSVGDLNADGFEDAFVSSGMGYPFRYAINYLLLNERGERFVDAEFLLGLEPRAGGRIETEYFTLDCSGADKDHPLCAGKSGVVKVPGPVSTRSAVVFDLDQDGDLDIVTAEFNVPPQVFVSNLTDKTNVHYLQVKLVGSRSNRDGLGARLKLEAGGKSYYRVHDGKSGYLSQSSLPLYFGLAGASKVDRITATWPSGVVQMISDNIPLNSLFVIKESAPVR